MTKRTHARTRFDAPPRHRAILVDVLSMEGES